MKHFLDVGLLGLDYFFVLSSFLITRLIIEEQARHNTFSFKLFFIRRSLRIWPLYFFMTGIGFTLAYAGFTHTPLPSLIYFVTFTLNLYIAKNGYDFLFFLVFLWSISVEEQFYVIWGLLLQFISRIGNKVFQYSIPITGLLLIVISLLYRYTHMHNELQLYFHTCSVASNFGVGMLLAYLGAYSKRFVSIVANMGKTALFFWGALLLLSVVTYTFVFTNTVAMLFERCYFSLLFASCIAILCYSKFVPRVQKFFLPFDYLGKISLGLYFYHGIVITVFSQLMMHYAIASTSYQVMFINPLVMMLLTILIAALSYNYFEKPILALKSNFYRQNSIRI